MTQSKETKNAKVKHAEISEKQYKLVEYLCKACDGCGYWIGYDGFDPDHNPYIDSPITIRCEDCKGKGKIQEYNQDNDSTPDNS